MWTRKKGNILKPANHLGCCKYENKLLKDCIKSMSTKQKRFIKGIETFDNMLNHNKTSD